MDGFYVAKFKVGKPAKASSLPNGTAVTAAIEDLDGVTEDEGEAEAAAFNDDEDAKIMEQEKIKQLKRKGIKVVPKDKQTNPNGPSKKKQRKL